MNHPKLNVIAGIVEKLFGFFEEYVELGQIQKFAIANSSIQELNACNLNLDKLSIQIQETERRRLYVIESLEQEFGCSLQKSSEFVTLFGDDAKDLVIWVEKLKKLMPFVNEIGQTNQKLIKSSREFVRSNMAILLGYTAGNPAQKFQTYGKTGAIPREFKQQVSLFNRQV
jgi:hypothetical protein